VKVGWGLDVHRFGGDPPVLLGGVVVDDSRGVEATSDGDVAAHALCDAVLATAALGDLGELFPSSDPKWRGADSMELLRACVASARAAGVEPIFADLTVIVQDLRVAPHRQQIRRNLAAVLGLRAEAVSVKATTTDRLGFIGGGEGLAAVAVVTAEVSGP
jgi:2-C-methyl-D-erythritol 2,4-cyclodiphosphate synthase